jgi:hypothetical protein
LNVAGGRPVRLWVADEHRYGLFLAHLAASDPDAEHIVIWDQAGFHPKPGLHAVPEHVPLVSLPPYSPELNPTEAIGDVLKDRIGNVLWEKLDDLEQALGEELRPLCENAECVRRLVSHPCLVEQANATATENSAITCSKWYDTADCILFNFSGRLLLICEESEIQETQ